MRSAAAAAAVASANTTATHSYTYAIVTYTDFYTLVTSACVSYQFSQLTSSVSHRKRKVSKRQPLRHLPACYNMSIVTLVMQLKQSVITGCAVAPALC